eukprot:scaffold122746_cov39-Attheya_sp.AAC.1
MKHLPPSRFFVVFVMSLLVTLKSFAPAAFAFQSHSLSILRYRMETRQFTSSSTAKDGIYSVPNTGEIDEATGHIKAQLLKEKILELMANSLEKEEHQDIAVRKDLTSLLTSMQNEFGRTKATEALFGLGELVYDIRLEKSSSSETEEPAKNINTSTNNIDDAIYRIKSVLFKKSLIDHLEHSVGRAEYKDSNDDLGTLLTSIRRKIGKTDEPLFDID